MNPDLGFALSLADDADAITTARFRAADPRVETKPDLTPVSEAVRLVDESSLIRCETAPSPRDVRRPRSTVAAVDLRRR